MRRLQKIVIVPHRESELGHSNKEQFAFSRTFDYGDRFIIIQRLRTESDECAGDKLTSHHTGIYMQTRNKYADGLNNLANILEALRTNCAITCAQLIARVCITKGAKANQCVNQF